MTNLERATLEVLDLVSNGGVLVKHILPHASPQMRGLVLATLRRGDAVLLVSRSGEACLEPGPGLNDAVDHYAAMMPPDPTDSDPKIAKVAYLQGLITWCKAEIKEIES